MARATDVGIVARAWIVRAAGAPPESDTGDLRAEETLAVDESRLGPRSARRERRFTTPTPCAPRRDGSGRKLGAQGDLGDAGAERRRHASRRESRAIAAGRRHEQAMITIGCAGFPVPATRYFKEFLFVEVQETHVSQPGTGHHPALAARGAAGLRRSRSSRRARSGKRGFARARSPRAR